MVLGLTGGVTVAPVANEMVMLGQGYLPAPLGIALGVARIAEIAMGVDGGAGVVGYKGAHRNTSPGKSGRCRGRAMSGTCVSPPAFAQR